MTETQKLDEVR